MFCSVRTKYWSILHVNGFPEETFEQRAKKVVSNSPGLLDFAIGLVNADPF